MRVETRSIPKPSSIRKGKMISRHASFVGACTLSHPLTCTILVVDTDTLVKVETVFIDVRLGCFLATKGGSDLADGFRDQL